MIFALTSYSTVQLFRPSAWAGLKTKAFVDAILFWGGFATITGCLGTLVGIVIAAQSIEAAGTVSTTLVWGGVKVALLSSVFGILVLAASSLVWFALQIKVGGYFVGDDYVNGGWWKGGVKKAVKEFVDEGFAKTILIRHCQFILDKVVQ